jgi:hypothetical protein
VLGAAGLVTMAAVRSAPEAVAARFPNSVTKRFAVSGEAATEWAAVLGLDPARDGELELELSRSHLHAVQIRDPAGVAPRALANVIRYAVSPSPTLSLEGEWLDSMTGSRLPVPRYTVSSEALTPDPSTGHAWERLARRLGLPGPAGGSTVPGAVLAERTSDARRLPWLRLAAYPVEVADGRRGYLIEVGVDDRPAAARARAMADYAARRRSGALE